MVISWLASSAGVQPLGSNHEIDQFIAPKQSILSTEGSMPGASP